MNMVEIFLKSPNVNRRPIRERLGDQEYSPPRHQYERPHRPQDVWMPFLQEQRTENRPRNLIDPWIQPTDNRASYDTAHHSRNFIASQYTSRDDSTMTNQGPETPDQETPRGSEYKQN